jgi:nicotinate-nucleotide pyrophosphorylase (carboxylating)
MKLLQIEIDEIVRRALIEDLGNGDVTTDALVPEDLQGRAVIVAKADGTLAGVDVARTVFLTVDPALQFDTLLIDGARLSAGVQTQEGDVIAEISGSVASILKGERVALNFLQHLSGIATATDQFVEAVKGFDIDILDTRKTMPGHRNLQKYAVTVGGGKNHRRDLSDGILIKDNHIAAGRLRGLDIAEIIHEMRRSAPHTLKVEIEVETLEQVREAGEAGADILMLDNMSSAEMTEAVTLIGGRALTEASGGITLRNVREVAASGVDMISVGALTHSVNSLDISLDLLEMG